MPGRVQLSRSGIRISKPGVEVSTANIKDLLLNIGQRQGQILEHGFMTFTSGNPNFPGNGPWSGSVSIGPYSQIPDVIFSLVLTGGRQINPQSFIPANSSFPVVYTFYDLALTTSSLAVKASGGGAGTVELTGCTYTIFRRPQIST